MNAEHEAVIRKIQKLQAHSENAQEIGNVAEAENYAAAMRRLMDQYRLTMSEVEFKDYREKDPVGEHRIKWESHGERIVWRRVAWVENLTRVVATAHGCTFLVSQGSNTITLVGRAQGCKIAEYTIVTLMRAARKLADAALAKEGREYLDYLESTRHGRWWDRTNNAKRWKASWLDGFTTRIKTRLDEELRGNAASATAIVRVKTELDDARAFVAHRPNAGALVSRKSIAHAYHRGEAAANNMDLKGRAVESDQRRVPALT